MNALADYILDWRDIPEVFVTVKAPHRRLAKGFGNMIDKYCELAGVPKVAFRGSIAYGVLLKRSWSQEEFLLRPHHR